MYFHPNTSLYAPLRHNLTSRATKKNLQSSIKIVEAFHMVVYPRGKGQLNQYMLQKNVNRMLDIYMQENITI